MLLASIGISVVLFAFAGLFVQVVGTPENIQATTAAFIRVKTAAIPITLLSVSLVVMVETINRKRLLFAVALLSVSYRFVFDSLFYGGYQFSLDFGVMGVAWSDAVANVALLVTMLFLLRPILWQQVASWRGFFTLKDWRTYIGVNTGSGLDSLVRNVAYFFLIVRLLNLLGEEAIGGYYLAMHIFWSFLLVPILALSESAKVLCGLNSSDPNRIRRIWLSSLMICAAIILVWVLLLPLWGSFAAFLNPDVAVVENSIRTVSVLFIPYAFLALNLVTDSVFYGIGKTRYMAYQSIITNGTVYLAAFIAYVTGIWIPTFDTILLLFALGIAVDSVLTAYFLFRAVPSMRSGIGPASHRASPAE